MKSIIYSTIFATSFVASIVYAVACGYEVVALAPIVIGLVVATIESARD